MQDGLNIKSNLLRDGYTKDEDDHTRYQF